MIDFLQLWQAHLIPGHGLDIGAGDGEISLWLAEHGFAVDALEPEQRNLQKLRLLFEPLPIRLHPINVLDFNIPAEHYSLIIASAVLHFIDAKQLPLLSDRLVKGLIPGGLLFAAVFTDDDPSALAADDLGPDRILHYFKPLEMLKLFPSLDVLFYDESRRVAPDSSFGFRAGATLVARRAP
ncbi:MAG: methyltransferase domain-containing protein [Anaerolineales bacterium]|nr:MAG: methyltransferase domain-containing protein [Anaerolineales bacterium]